MCSRSCSSVGIRLSLRKLGFIYTLPQKGRVKLPRCINPPEVHGTSVRSASSLDLSKRPPSFAAKEPDRNGTQRNIDPKPQKLYL